MTSRKGMGAPPGIVRISRALLVLFVFLLSLCAADGLRALEIDGRLSSSSFISETFPPDQEKQWDLINRLSINARELGHSSLSLHWSGAYRGEVLEEGVDKSRLRSYHGYLRYQPRPEAVLALGRQWVYAGVGSGRLDGARLQFARTPRCRLTLFAGTRGFLDPDSDSFDGLDGDAFDESGIWGGDLRVKALAGRLGFGLSAARLYRAEAEEARRLGFTLNWRPLARGSVNYEQRYDLNQELAYYQHLRLHYRLSQGSASLAWNRREGYPPGGDQSYIARYFRDRDWFTASFSQLTDEIRGQLSMPCRLLTGWTVNLQLLEIFPDGEDRGDGFSIGLARHGYAFGYRLQRGFGGDQDGLYGHVRYELRESTWVWLDLNKVYYRFGEVEDLEDELVVDDESLATRIGIDALIGDNFDITTALELLNNPRAEHQIRFLGRIGYRFQRSSQK